MGGWAPLPEEIDLPAYEDWQGRENQRNPKGADVTPVAGSDGESRCYFRYV